MPAPSAPSPFTPYEPFLGSSATGWSILSPGPDFWLTALLLGPWTRPQLISRGSRSSKPAHVPKCATPLPADLVHLPLPISNPISLVEHQTLLTDTPCRDPEICSRPSPSLTKLATAPYLTRSPPPLQELVSLLETKDAVRKLA